MTDVDHAPHPPQPFPGVVHEQTVHAVGGLGAAPQLEADRLHLRHVPLILMYHAVVTVARDPNKICVTPSRFAEQMAWLERHGLRGVGIGMLADAMRTGRQHGLVGITFDDGYVNVIEGALPVLRSHGFGATVFVVTGRLGGTNDWEDGSAPSWPLVSARQVETLAAAGIEIGSHGVNHVPLAGARPAELSSEVGASRAQLAAIIGTEIRGFAYPYGSMDARARQAVRDAGYEYACAVDVKASDKGLMALPRVYIGQQDGVARMAVKRHLYRGYIAIKGRRS